MKIETFYTCVRAQLSRGDKLSLTTKSKNVKISHKSSQKLHIFLWSRSTWQNNLKENCLHADGNIWKWTDNFSTCICTDFISVSSKINVLQSGDFKTGTFIHWWTFLRKFWNLPHLVIAWPYIIDQLLLSSL